MEIWWRTIHRAGGQFTARWTGAFACRISALVPLGGVEDVDLAVSLRPTVFTGVRNGMRIARDNCSETLSAMSETKSVWIDLNRPQTSGALWPVEGMRFT